MSSSISLPSPWQRKGVTPSSIAEWMLLCFSSFHVCTNLYESLGSLQIPFVLKQVLGEFENLHF